MSENGNPLWLPNGSVRATLAVIVIGSLSYAFLVGKEVPDRFWELGLLVAGAYFISKVVAKT